MRRGKIRGTNILTGTRYVQINDVVNTIPTEIEVGEFQIRVFCDNGKTECKHCGDTSHPSYRCPLRPGQTKICFRCYSTSHLVDKCQNEVVCNHCGQPGHRQKECDAKKEIEQYGDYRYEIAEGRESANLEATSSQIKMKKTAPTEEKTDVLITVAADLVEPTKPTCTPIPVIVSGNIVTNSTKSNKNNENNSESGPSSSSPSRNTNNKDVEIRRSDSNNNSTTNSTDVNISSSNNDISNNMLIIGASLLNHIESPDGVIISNQSGATLDMAEQLVNAAEEDSDQELKPDQVVIHLGTNDVMYIGSSAPAVIVKLGIAMDRIHQKYPAAKIGLCPIPPRKGNSSDQEQCNEVARVVNELTCLYMSSLADAQPDQYTFIDTWSKLWSSKGHAIKQYYDSNDPKDVHLSKKGKELLINKIMSTMCPTTAKRKSSSTHSPSADNNTKEQRLDSQQNVDLITFTDTQ